MPEHKKNTQTFTKEELQELLEGAAQEGAKRALAEVGLHDEGAGKDIKELRSLIGSYRFVKTAFWKAVIEKLIGAGTMFLLGFLSYKYGVNK